METPSFAFRLRRVRDLRERVEEHARELQLRMRGEALLREATHAVDAARDTGSGIFRRACASGADMRAAHDREMARRAQIDLDDVALGVHHRGRVAACIAAAVARVSEREQMLRFQAPGTAARTSPGSFASQLRCASVATGTATAAAGATGAVSELPTATPYAAEITAAARKHGVGPALLAGLVKQESNFDPDAGSPAGEQGLTKLMPATAASLGVTNVHDPVQALEGGAKYRRRQLNRFGGDVARALAAYNAGPGAVERLGGVRPYAETQEYVRRVQANAAEFRATGSAGAASTARTAVLSTSPSIHGIV